MKLKALLIVLTGLLLCSTAQAAEITLQWDANSPAPDGYALFRRDASMPNGYDYNVPVWPTDGQDHQETSALVTIPDDMESAFVCRAYDKLTALDGTVTKNWSGDSNEVTHMPSVIVDTPQNLILQVVQALSDAIKKLALAAEKLD